MQGMLRPPVGGDENRPWGIDKMRQRLSKLAGGTGMLAGGEDHLQGDKSRYARYAAGATRSFNPQNVGAGLNQIGHNIANGMLAGREMGRMNRTAGQEKAAWGMLGDPSAMLKSAPVGGAAHQYALKKREAAAAHEAQQNDPAYQARLKNMQLRNDKLEHGGGGRFHTTNIDGQTMQQGPDGRLYPMPGHGGAVDFYEKTVLREKAKADAKLQEKAQVKNEAGRNIGNMIDRLGQVVDPERSPYTPHEVESSIGPLQGGESGITNPLNMMAKVGGWLETLGSNHAPRDIRARIQGDALALSAAVKKVARGAGEGTFTDSDQQVLERQIGELTKSSNIADYKQRLDDLKERINAAYGLSIGKKEPTLDADEIAVGRTAVAPNGDRIRWDGNDWVPAT